VLALRLSRIDDGVIEFSRRERASEPADSATRIAA
jgi:hypothetical protein